MRRFLFVLPLVVTFLAAVSVIRADERVDVTAMDGVQLIAELGGTRGPGVVMVHDAHEDRRSWQAAADAVVARGFRVLRVDLRGRGESAGAVDPGAADRDVEGAYRYLLGRKIRPVFLVGKGAAATAILQVAARVSTAGIVIVAAPDAKADATKDATPLLRLENVTDPEAIERLASWLSLH